MFPHIAIIDARTGRLLWRKEGWTMESPFSAEDFAEMAMDVCSRHSLDKPPSAKKPKKEEKEQVVLYSSEEEEAEKEPSFLEMLLATTVAPEPATGGARIQIRMPNAKRLVRKFDPADTLKSIYAFVAVSSYYLFNVNGLKYAAATVVVILTNEYFSFLLCSNPTMKSRVEKNLLLQPFILLAICWMNSKRRWKNVAFPGKQSRFGGSKILF
jgi:hypothetical protein